MHKNLYYFICSKYAIYYFVIDKRTPLKQGALGGASYVIRLCFLYSDILSFFPGFLIEAHDTQKDCQKEET